MFSSYQAVLFDFFGTLTQAVQRGPAHERIARRLGCTPTEFYRALDDSFPARSIGAYGDPATALSLVAAQLGAHPSRRALAAILAERIAAVRADTRLRPGAVDVLRRLRRFGVSTALISDCGPELPVFLPSLPIAAHLDTYVLSIEVGRRKPDPTMYLTACARLDVRPEDCLYIGDGGSHELTGALAVGMTAIRLDAPDLVGHLTFRADTAFDGPSIRSLYEVLTPVERLDRVLVPV